MKKLHLFSLRALVWLSYHIKLCFCAFFLCHCFCTHISRFAFLFLHLFAPSFHKTGLRFIIWVTWPRGGWPVQVLLRTVPHTGHPASDHHIAQDTESHISYFIISVLLFGKPFFFFFISSMKTCCYKAFLLTTEIPLSLFQVASWFFLSKVFPFLSQLY